MVNLPPADLPGAVAGTALAFLTRMRYIAYVNAYLDKLKALGEEVRFRLARVLVEAGEPLCLPELVDIVRRPQYAVSRAMVTLARAGLVVEERRGRLRYYRLADDPFSERLFRAVASAPPDDTSWLYDRDRLRWRLELREEGRCVVTYTAGYAPPEYKAGEESMDEFERRKVLVVCVHNTARSQMAEAYLRHFAGDIFEVESAGLEPGTLNPYVVRVMAEDGFDISHKAPQSVFDVYQSGRTFTYVITVCSREAEEGCPIFPGPVRRLSWPFPDPSQFEGTDEQILEQTREVRNVMREEARRFAEHYRNEHGLPQRRAGSRRST